MATRKKRIKAARGARKDQGGTGAAGGPSQRETNQRQDSEDIRRAIDDGMQDLRMKKPR